jgi:ribonuclease PH
METRSIKLVKRADHRSSDQIRSVCLSYNLLGYAESSVLYEQGETKILCSISLQNKVPHFLKGKRVGWLNAEYAMLPCATKLRTNREINLSHRNARSVEISRLIGRCLRTTVDLIALGERTIVVDCDVLQADGGTRVACITAASIALKQACIKWHTELVTEKNIFKEPIAAISAGIVDEIPYLDLSYSEDCNAVADFNFVITKSKKLVEVQGTAEKEAISWDDFELLKKMAIDGTTKLFETFDTIATTKISGASIFSIGSRIKSRNE